jgi:choline transport protein
LIYIGSSVAYNDVISMSVSGLYASYLLPHRSRDNDQGDQIPIRPTTALPNFGTFLMEEGEEIEEVLKEAELEWGPWSVPGWLGIANNTYACVFCAWVLLWSLWPPGVPVTTKSMNYSSLVTGTVIAFAITRYFLGVKATYRGLLVDYEVRGFAIQNP